MDGRGSESAAAYRARGGSESAAGYRAWGGSEFARGYTGYRRQRTARVVGWRIQAQGLQVPLEYDCKQDDV